MTRFVRTRGGEMVHRSDCRHAKTGLPWFWADQVNLRDVERVVTAMRYKTCHDCDPMADSVLEMQPGVWVDVPDDAPSYSDSYEWEQK